MQDHATAVYPCGERLGLILPQAILQLAERQRLKDGQLRSADFECLHEDVFQVRGDVHRRRTRFFEQVCYPQHRIPGRDAERH